MSKRAKIIIILGILTALMPIMGLPGKIESVIIILLGITVAGVMYFAEKRVSKCEDCNNNKDEAFQENIKDKLPNQPTPEVTPEQEKIESIEKKSENQNKESEGDSNDKTKIKPESELEQKSIKVEIKKE